MVVLSSDLSDVRKSWTEDELAKRTAEETIAKERKEHEEKVSGFVLLYFKNTHRGLRILKK